MKRYLKLMRVHHYIKNILVFGALLCSGEFFNLTKLRNNFWGFVAFSMVSSIVYIINDIHDKEKDAKHPTKCKRPIASGSISVKKAWVLASVLLFIVVILCLYTFDWIATGLLILYLFLNLAYSFGLKNIPIADIAILVSGFLIRLLYGALITNIVISNWLYLSVISLSFYFALGKRRNELRQNSSCDTREVLKSYSIGFLDKNMNMFLTLANVFYALWSMDENTKASYDSEYMVLTVPIVLLITLKYSLSVEGDSDGDPVEILLHDKVLLSLCLLFFISIFCILYI